VDVWLGRGMSLIYRDKNLFLKKSWLKGLTKCKLCCNFAMSKISVLPI